MSARKTLLVLSGGIEAVPGIQRAKDLGLFVVVCDGNPSAPGLALADDAVSASIYDVEESLAAALEYHRNTRKLDGVMCIAADTPLAVARIADEIGLPGIPVSTARIAIDKLAMKARFAARGIPIPWYAPVESAIELRTIIAEQGFPLVLKPVDSRGARGVLRLTEGINVGWAYSESRQHSPSGRVMVEQYLAGPQISTESIVVDGVAHTPGFADRNYELLDKFLPYMIEDGGELPSALPEAQQAAVRGLVNDAARGLDIRNGVLKGDIVVFEGKPHAIEFATRLSGGYFCTHTIPHNTGVDFIGNAIRLALGEQVDPKDLVPKFNRPVAQRYFFPSAGIVTSVGSLETFRANPNVLHVELRVAPGDLVQPIHNHPARAGVVMTTGASRSDAVALARRIAAEVRVETTPVDGAAA